MKFVTSVLVRVSLFERVPLVERSEAAPPLPSGAGTQTDVRSGLQTSCQTLALGSRPLPNRVLPISITV